MDVLHSYIPSQNLQIAANFASVDGGEDDQMLEMNVIDVKLYNLLRLQTKIIVFKQIKKYERKKTQKCLCLSFFNNFPSIESFFSPVKNNLKILLKSQMSKPCSSMKHPLYDANVRIGICFNFRRILNVDKTGRKVNLFQMLIKQAEKFKCD